MRTTLLFYLMSTCLLTWHAKIVRADTTLTNGGFESPLGASFAAVLDPVPPTFGAWGAESGSVVGPENGITPFAGSSMLRLNGIGGVVTQVVQRVDVSSQASDIDAGQVLVSVEALFNAPDFVPAAVAGINISFINDGPFTDDFNIALSNSIGSATTSSVIDNDPLDWEPLSIDDFFVPAGTRSLVVEFNYSNASLGLDPGYVDAATLSITTVPEPSGCVLLTTLLLGYLSRQHRKV